MAVVCLNALDPGPWWKQFFVYRQLYVVHRTIGAGD